MWNLVAFCDDAIRVFEQLEQELKLEQAVRGMDMQREVLIQSRLADGLSHKYDVVREVHYPSSRGKRLSHRQRCDLVLTPRGAEAAAPGTASLPGVSVRPALHDALWLEIKVAYQFREGGLRHRGYGAQWRSKIVNDLRKLHVEPLVQNAAFLLVVFNHSLEILWKDLDQFELLLSEKEVLAGSRKVRSIPIQDRIGHQFCSLSLWPIIQRTA